MLSPAWCLEWLVLRSAGGRAGVADRSRRASVHFCTLDELEPMDLAFDVPLAPWHSECFADGVDVLFQTSGEARQDGTWCGFKPC